MPYPYPLAVKELERTTDETIPRDILWSGGIVYRWWLFPGESDVIFKTTALYGRVEIFVKMKETLRGRYTLLRNS